MSLHLSALFLLALTLPLAAEMRPWKSADGQQTVQGEFVKRDASTVTLRLTDGKQLSFEIAKLHADEKTWLNLHHPASGQPLPDESAVFDTLKFGDSHDAVLAKLKASKMVKMTIDENLIGRVGLNGIFRIRYKIGGLDAMLYFDWTDDEKLKEIAIRTATYPAESYDQKLAPSWKEFIDLLNTLHGKPVQAAPPINLASVPEGTMLASHVWRIESGGSALLGIGREGKDYQVVVRFTMEAIQPAAIRISPKPAVPDFDFNP
jgi:hypothetical protein